MVRSMVNDTSHPELLKNLVLIGGRGCGKSSVAKRVLRKNRNFMLFSLDALIRYEAGGLSIPAIVEREGWEGFRDLEFRVVERLEPFQEGALLDCGGGVVVDLDEHGEEVFSQRKVNSFRRNGLVVYLRRDPEYLIERIGQDPNRPKLSDTRSFSNLMARRDAWYQKASDLVVECGDRSKNDLVDLVLDWFYAHQAPMDR